MSSEVWIKGEQDTVLDLLARRMEADPDREYLDVCGVKSSAADVADAAGRIAGALAGFGVERGDRVATLIENSSEAMLAWWGIVAGGAVAYMAYRLAGLPAASVLALAVALGSFVPDLGIVVVGIPIALLGGGLEGSLAWGVAILVGHVARGR